MRHTSFHSSGRTGWTESRAVRTNTMSESFGLALAAARVTGTTWHSRLDQALAAFLDASLERGVMKDQGIAETPKRAAVLRQRPFASVDPLVGRPRLPREGSLDARLLPGERDERFLRGLERQCDGSTRQGEGDRSQFLKTLFYDRQKNLVAHDVPLK